MITADLIINLFLILTVAWALGLVFTRFGMPAMLGELMAGIILGPPLLGLVAISEPIELIAELGIFFVMFHTGMELDPKALLKQLGPSLAVAAGGFILPFASGFLVAYWFGGTVYQSLFVGLGLSITAIAVQAVILHNLSIHRTDVGHIILGAAIADDILSLIVLSMLLGLAKTGQVDLIQLGLIVIKVVSFFGLTIVMGHFVLPRFTRKLTNQGERAFTFALASALLMAYLAELAGLHLIIGAFLAGQFVRKEIVNEKVYQAILERFEGVSYGFLVPIFFASLAFHLHFSWSLDFILFAAVLTVAAVLGKLIGAGAGAALFGYGPRESMVIGFGMNGRGAVELVVATVIINLSNDLMQSNVITEPLLTQEQFSALVLMAFVTTLLAPITLRMSVVKSCSLDEKAEFCRLWDENTGKEP